MRELWAAFAQRSVLKSLWALGVLIIIVFSIIYIDRIFDLIRGFEELRALASYLRQLITRVAEWDKVVHFLAYGIVALIGFIAVSKQKYRLRIAAGMIGLGISLEIIQLLVPGRSFEFHDWFADVLGVAAAYSILIIYRKIGLIRFNKS